MLTWSEFVWNATWGRGFENTSLGLRVDRSQGMWSTRTSFGVSTMVVDTNLSNCYGGICVLGR